MDVSLLGVMAWWKTTMAVIFLLVCVVLIILVLLQKGRGGGLSAAFGGAGGQSAFGSKTGDVFTWVTIVAAGVFLLLAMVMTMSYTPDNPDADLPGGGIGPGPADQSGRQQTPPDRTVLPPPGDEPMPDAGFGGDAEPPDTGDEVEAELPDTGGEVETELPEAGGEAPIENDTGEVE